MYYPNYEKTKEFHNLGYIENTRTVEPHIPYEPPVIPFEAIYIIVLLVCIPFYFAPRLFKNKS